VRNTAFLLLIVVIVLAAGLFLPAFFTPAGTLPTEAMAADPNGLTLNISLNTTRVFAPSGVAVTIWINGSSAIENVTALDSWPLNQTLLWKAPCTPGWPMGVGVMLGYYDQYNYSSGALLPLNQPTAGCPPSSGVPISFLVQAEGSKAIISMNGSDETWDLLTTLVLTKSSVTPLLTTSEVFTVIGADEWGDVVILHFVAE